MKKIKVRNYKKISDIYTVLGAFFWLLSFIAVALCVASALIRNLIAFDWSSVDPIGVAIVFGVLACFVVGCFCMRVAIKADEKIELAITIKNEVKRLSNSGKTLEEICEIYGVDADEVREQLWRIEKESEV